MDLLVKSIAN